MNGMITHEGHLGGFLYDGDPATDFPHLYEHVVKDLKINSVIEIGCGRGFALKKFQDLGCKVIGLDGSPTAIQHNLVPDRVKQIDFTKSQVLPEKTYDLAFSVEFVEHVEEQYMKNYLPCFECANYIVMTYAGPGQGGHHHVNCQPKEYWINIFKDKGFIFDEEYTNTLKQKAKEDRMVFCPTFDGNHFEHRGLFFRKQ